MHTYIPNVHILTGLVGSTHANRGIEITIVEFAIPGHINGIPTHELIDSLSVERIGQRLHVWSVLATLKQGVGKTANRHIGDGQE